MGIGYLRNGNSKQASNMWRERQAENLRTKSKVQRHHEEWAQGLDEAEDAEPDWYKTLPKPDT